MPQDLAREAQRIEEAKAAKETAQPVKRRPKRTPDEWGMLKEYQLPNAVMMEKNVNMTKVDGDGNIFEVVMPPKRVFFLPKDVERAKEKGYTIVEDPPHWKSCQVRSEPIAAIAVRRVEEMPIDPNLPISKPEPKGAKGGKK